MTTIRFALRDGGVRDIDAANGESVMRAAVASGIPGILGECGGEMSCATCHVYVAPEWVSLLPPAGADECDLLELVDGYRPELSRLGCQIVLDERLDGIELEVAPED